MFLLALLCVLGGEAIWQGASRVFRSVALRLKLRRESAPRPNLVSSNTTPLIFVALVVLIPYFLFNSGLPFELTRSSELVGARGIPSSWALSSYRVDMFTFNEKEAEAIAWLAQRLDGNTPVYGDHFGRLLLCDRFYGQVGTIPASGEVPDEAYVFLRRWNIEKQQIAVVVRRGVQKKTVHIDLSDMPTLLDNREIGYDNGDAQIWVPRRD